MGYIKCPRCNLNYINESESLCYICLIETGKIERKVEDEFEEDEDYEICPECGENLIKPNETMCTSCAALVEQTKLEKEPDEFEDIADEIPEIDEEEEIYSTEKLVEEEDEDEDLDDL
ncbi:MAG TPA: hypothetical protein PLZ84_00480 [Clostridia bacterium]|nr:hypothetical protein [Clostridia bacterium]